MRHGFVPVVVALAFNVATVRAQPTAEESLAVAAARRRQETIKSADIVFRIKETTEAGAMTPDGIRSGAISGAYPAKQFSCESTNRIVLDRDRMRHEDNHPIPHVGANEFKSNQGLCVSDGKTAKRLFHPVGSATRDNAVAKITTPEQASTADFVLYLPIHLSYRGIQNVSCQSAYTMPQFRATGNRSKIGAVGVEEHILNSRGRTSNVRLWTDPNQEHAVKRIRHENIAGVVTWQIDVRYTQEATTSLWLPQTWTYTLYGSGGVVRRTFTVDVDSLKVNHRINDEEFDFAFPPGIELWDERTNTYYLVRDDGTYHRLDGAGQKSDAISASLRSTWLSRNVWWLLCGMMAVVGLGIVVYRSHMRRRATTDTDGSAEPPPADHTSGGT
jgi:hypothetical protein